MTLSLFAARMQTDGTKSPMNTRITILSLSVWFASACAGPDGDRHTLLGDPWNEELRGRYVVGGDVALRLTDRVVYDDGRFSLRLLAPCEDVECIPVEDLRIESTRPEVFAVEHTPEGPIGRALAPGEAELIARVNDHELVRETVVVAQPERLEIWPESLDEILAGSVPHRTRVLRMAGGVLDLNVRFYAGTDRLYGAGLARFTSDLPFEVATWARTGNVIRVSGDDVGIETVRVEALGLSTTVEVETVSAVDRLTLVPLSFAFTEPEAGWSSVLPIAELDGAALHGELPVEWEVDGETVGVGGVVACLHAPGASVVVARIGELEASVALDVRCAATGIDPWFAEEVVD